MAKSKISDWADLASTKGEDKSFMLEDPVPAVTGAEAPDDNALGRALHEFIHDVLPRLTPDQYFELVCAIPREHQVKDELYEGEEDGNITLQGQVRRMMTAVKAMSDKVFINGRVKHDTDIADAQKVFNACSSAFKSLLNFEKEIFTLERLQAVERVTLKILKDRHPHIAEEFLGLLEEELAKAS